MNRFHSKFHRKNHHTDTDPYNPDAGHDPIASESAPFQGNFYLNGSLSASNSFIFGSGLAGKATLVTNASALITTTKALSTSLIFLTTQSPSGTLGIPFVRSISHSTSFMISSTNINDKSTVGWFIMQTQ
jgi:hypothetical protein